jgi:precorrin-6B methylase 2
MKFPIKILSRSRWERLKGNVYVNQFYHRLMELQLSEAVSDSILNHASLHRLDPNDEFEVLDVGANQGDWALTMAALFPKARILAIEADPKTFETLCCRVACREQIRPVNVAIHSTNKAVTFHSH